MAYLHIDNSELMICLENAAKKMLAIEEKHAKNFLVSSDVINRMKLCVFDTIHDYINVKLQRLTG